MSVQMTMRRYLRVLVVAVLVVFALAMLAALTGCQSSTTIKGGESSAQAVREEVRPSTTTQTTRVSIGSAPSPESRTSTLRIWIPPTPNAECSK